MAYFFGDGFDCYRDLADCATYWDATLGPALLLLSASGRFAGSRGVTMNFSPSTTPYITKTSGINDAVHHISVAVQQTFALSGTSNGMSVTLYDGATAQCTVAFRSDGALVLTAGLSSGTTLATYAGAIAALNIWYQFEIEVVINNTAGSISVRRNGSTSNDFTLGSLNTRASANNYANKIGISNNWNASATQTIDDFLWRSDASSVAWIGDVRCYTRMPAADSAVQFTKSPASVVPVMPFFPGTTTSINNISQRFVPFVATCDGSVGSAAVSLASGYTGNMKCSMFTNSATTTPGTILGSATTISNPAAGYNTFTFGTPVAVTRGTSYWIGFASDTSSGSWNVASGSTYNTTSGATSTGATSYAAFPVANPSVNTGQQGTVAVINITPTTAANANLVTEVMQDGAASYVLSSTNGQADLYTLQSIPGTPPVTVIGVTTRGLFQKSDAGTRNATVQLKSGGTTVAGTSTALPVGSWQWIARNDLVDPATSTAWTASAVNAALVGPAVTV